MIVAEGGKRRAIEQHHSGGSFAHLADAGQGQSLRPRRHPGVRRHGEEQLVVLSAVKRLLEGGAGKSRGRLDGGANLGRQAQALEVYGEPVAQIHRGRSSEALAQESPQCEAWFGTQVAAPGGRRAARPARQSQRRAAQAAGNVDGISRACPIAPQCATARRGAAHDDVAHQLAAPCHIAARQGHAGAPAEAQQTTVKFIHPRLVRPPRYCQRKQEKAGLPSHGSYIAQTARQRFPPHIRCAVRLTAEVDILDQQVCSEQQILAPASRAEDGAIVSDPQHDPRAATAGFVPGGWSRSREQMHDPVDEFLLIIHWTGIITLVGEVCPPIETVTD
jgi:hypothetical protein